MPRLPVKRSSDSPGLFSSSGSTTKKSFTLPLHPVPESVYASIASRLTTNQPWLGQKAELDKAQKKVQDAQEALQMVQEQLKDLGEQRAQAKQDVQDQRVADMKQAWQQLEDSIRAQFEASIKEKEQIWEKEKQVIRDEADQKMKQIRYDFQKSREKGQRRPSSLEEPPAKKIKLSDGSQNPETDPRSTDDAMDESMEDGDAAKRAATEATAVAPPLPLPAADDDDKNKLSYAKNIETEALQKKADELAVTKASMAWLLKTIINTEKKLKEEAKEKSNP